MQLFMPLYSGRNAVVHPYKTSGVSLVVEREERAQIKNLMCDF